jgi:type I restriction enzyme S subunit
MVAASATVPRAFAVLFRDLGRWDASSFHRIQWHWPQRIMVPIGSVLRLRKERVDKAKFKFSDLQPITIHFDGSVDKRVVDANREYSMDLWFARPGDIVVAKIDLKNGAVGIVPDGWNNVVVTGHFAVYEPDMARLLPEYFHLIVQAKFFRAHLWRNKVGAEGRKEVKLDFFEMEHVPLPPLAEQNAIVARWRKARDEIADALNRIDGSKTAIEARFLSDVGLRSIQQIPTSKAFAVWWNDVDRWGVQMIGINSLGRHKSLFPEIQLSDLCSIGSGGTPSRQNIKYFGGAIPWVKTTEVRNEVIATTEEALTEDGLKNSSAKIYPKGSLIVAMYGQGATRGRTAKLGIDAATNQACAVLSGFAPQIEPDFLWYFLISQYDNIRALASGNNQPNLNANMIANLRVPVPPRTIQQQVIKRVAAGRAEIARERESVENLTKSIHAEIEALILGTKSVKDA